MTHGAIAPDSLIRAGQTLLWFGDVPAAPPHGHSAIIGQSYPVQLLHHAIDRVAHTPLPVLILGETGTGKELVARRVHQLSERRGAFIAVNCGAIPTQLAEAYFFGHKKGAFTGALQDSEGCWLAADGGTLFLDEIGDLPLDLQTKILRVLDDGEVTAVGTHAPVRCDPRIIAATNIDLRRRVEAGTFRRDLFARLQGYTLETPALRDRRRDILLLVRHFMARPGRALNVQVAECLVQYDWPMNIRELAAVAKRLVIDAPDGDIRLTHLPLEIRERPEVTASGREATPSAAELEALLAKHGGNIAEVATHFGKGRYQVYRWLSKLQIDPDKFRAP